MRTAVLSRETRWACPNCQQTAVTREGRPHSQFHACRGLAGMVAPLVEAGVRCKVEAVERGDYIGGEHVRLDGNGRPVMAVRTVRDDGYDTAVMAPLATIGQEVYR